MGAERPKAKHDQRRRQGRRHDSPVPTKLKIGAAAVSVLVYLLLIGGMTCVLLGTLVVATDVLVWRGLAFPLDAARGLVLLIGGAALAGLGVLAWRFARRFI